MEKFFEALVANNLLGQAILVVLGFLLTSVIGAFVGAYFQKRNWNHQRKVTNQDEETLRAQEVFDVWSSLMDRRLYRYRQIIYAFRSEDEARINEKFSDYVTVLYEWNDGLNKNYARLEQYYGKPIRVKLEETIVKDFIFIGSLLEREKKQNADAVGLEKLRALIDDLNAKVYRFNLTLLERIGAGTLGANKDA